MNPAWSPARSWYMSLLRVRSISTIGTPSSLIACSTIHLVRQSSLNRKQRLYLKFLNHQTLLPAAVATPTSLWQLLRREGNYWRAKKLSAFFLFREACFDQLSLPRSAAQRTLDASARMARRTEDALLFLLRSALTVAADASRARRLLPPAADILTEHSPDIFTEQ